MDFGKAFDSAKYIIGISLAFNFIAFVIYAVLIMLGLISGAAIGAASFGLGIAGVVAILLWGINQLVNFGIIVYGGYRGAKHGLDIVSCGLVGMLSWAIVAPIMGIIQFIADIVFNVGMQATGVMETAVSGMNPSGIIMQLMCLFGVYLLGFGINFVVAVIGGFAGGAK